MPSDEVLPAPTPLAVGSGEMDPCCDLGISTVSELPQTVEPDVFEIWRVGRSISPSSD